MTAGMIEIGILPSILRVVISFGTAAPLQPTTPTLPALIRHAHPTRPHTKSFYKSPTCPQPAHFNHPLYLDSTRPHPSHFKRPTSIPTLSHPPRFCFLYIYAAASLDFNEEWKLIGEGARLSLAATVSVSLPSRFTLSLGFFSHFSHFSPFPLSLAMAFLCQLRYGFN